MLVIQLVKNILDIIEKTKELREEKNEERIENNKIKALWFVATYQEANESQDAKTRGGQPPSSLNYNTITNPKYIWNINVNPYK
ncbi:hypothetical protein DPQ31_28210 [Bacillus sp. COPE52]|nr:hypothetical protein DPQ31_28210 [Bacillus sp. COPE52]